jgi:hypothetical protein
MIATISPERRTRALEFGIYRDGDNNLDKIQSLVLNQAVAVSAQHPSIEFTVEDSSAYDLDGNLGTRNYRLDDGHEAGLKTSGLHDMSSRANLAAFVARTLDNAEAAGAAETWIDLVDHGAGDGGGLEADHARGATPDPDGRRVGIMREDDIAGALADGVALHAKRHPEDAQRGVDGVVANQCLMATLGFSSALSHAGVRYLAASPETMLAPGVPSEVAIDIAEQHGDPASMAQAVVNRVMDTRYFPNGADWSPAAAFDVLDLAPAKIAAMESRVKNLDGALAAAAHDRSQRGVIREDAKAIDGMVRFPKGKHLPWRADRPALELYNTFAADGRLPSSLREAAHVAGDAIRKMVLAHRETGDFAPFGDADYGDAAGPTVHFPLSGSQIDPWAPQVSETDNAFYKAVGADKLTQAIA